MRTLRIHAVVLMLPTVAMAGGYAIPNENARELGLSQATVAAQTGPEAISLNAAALAGEQGLAVSASVEGLYNQTDWSDPTYGQNGKASLVPKMNFPPALAVAYGNKLPNGMRYGLGLGMDVPGGGSLVWPRNWAGASRIQSVIQEVYRFQAGLAFQPVEGVRIGGTLNYFRGSEKLVQGLNYLDHSGDATLGLAGGAVSYGVSGEFRIPSAPVTLGINYRHKADAVLSGHAHFEDVPPSFQALLLDQGVKEQFTIPNELFVGAAVKVTPNVQIMGAWSFERWVVFKSDTFVGDKGFTVTVPRNDKNAWVYRLAGEWTEAFGVPHLTLRLGGLRSMSPQPTDTVSPSLTDGNSWAISTGAGYEPIPGLRVDLGYQHAIFDSVTATGSEAWPGTYQTKVDLISLGFTWRFDI